MTLTLISLDIQIFAKVFGPQRTYHPNTVKTSGGIWMSRVLQEFKFGVTFSFQIHPKQKSSSQHFCRCFTEIFHEPIRSMNPGTIYLHLVKFLW